MTPTPDTPAVPSEAEAHEIACACRHGLQWHHPQRGCGYLGAGPDRCRCLRDIETALADSDWLREHDARVRAEAWDEGYEAGGDDMFPTRNPYRTDPEAAR